MRNVLDNKTVVIMGASAGIGFATACAFAEAGAKVVLTGRHLKNLDAAAARITQGKIQMACVDGAKIQQVDEFFTRTTEIDHLVVSFGSADSSRWFLDMDLAYWRRHFDDKFFAHLGVLQHALPSMRQNGSITMVTGSSARSAVTGTSLWAATDGAMDAAIPSLALEFAPIRINAVSPGLIRTRWWDRLPATQRDQVFDLMARRLPAGRIGTPGDVAHAIRFLAENGYVTGVVLGVDGGGPLVG